MVLDMIASAVDVREAVVNEVSHELVDHAVERVAPVVAPGDKAQSTQDRELLARDGLRDVEGACKVPHAHLVMNQRVDDRYAQRIRQCLEDLYGVREHAWIRQSGPGL